MKAKSVYFSGWGLNCNGYDENFELCQYIDNDIDLTVHLEKYKEEELQKLIPHLNHRFRLFAKPLVEMRIFETEKYIYIFLLSHHIMMDGTAIGIVMSTLTDYYEGKTPSLDYFYTFLAENEVRHQSEEFKKADHYFTELLSETDWCENMIADKICDKYKSRIKYNIIKDMDSDSKKKLISTSGSTFNVISAAICILSLAKSENKKDILINWVFQNRNKESDHHAAGLLIRLLPIAVHLDKMDTLKDLYQEISSQINEGIAHNICEWNLEHDIASYSKGPYFLIYESDLLNWSSILGHGAESVPVPMGGLVYRQMTLTVIDTDECMVFNFSNIDEEYTQEHMTRYRHSAESMIDILCEAKNPGEIKIIDII